MDEGERVEQLEAIVQKLTVENQKLLTHTKEEEETDNLTSKQNGQILIKEGDDINSEEELISLNDMKDLDEDEWLYISPIRPPTKDQKTLTPSQWLEDGRKHNFSAISSLNEVRKTLAFTLDEEARTTSSSIPSKFGTPRRLQPSNTTAKKYLDQVRLRKSSQSESEDSSSEKYPSPPRIISPTNRNSHSIHPVRNIPVKPVTPQGNTVLSNNNSRTESPPLKVKWIPREVSDSEESISSTGEKPIPVPQPTNSLKINWNPSNAVTSDSEEEENEITRSYTIVRQVETLEQVQNSSTPSPELSEPKRQATVQRRGTFTKEKKVIKPPTGDSSLKVKWVPKSTSPSSSEDDLSRTSSPNVGREDEVFTSYPTLTKSPIQQRGITTPTRYSPVHTSPIQRGMSPNRHGTSSPLQYQRKGSVEGIITSHSPSPSPRYLTTPTSRSLHPPSPKRNSEEHITRESRIQSPQTTPMSRSLRPPSPKRNSQEQITMRESRLQSPGQTTPTRIQSPGHGMSKLKSPTTPTGVQARSPGSRGISPVRSSGQGVKIPQSLTTQPTGRGHTSPTSPGQRRRILPVTPNTGRGQRQIRRGGVRQTPGVYKGSALSPNPPPVDDEAWLEGCF